MQVEHAPSSVVCGSDPRRNKDGRDLLGYPPEERAKIIYFPEQLIQRWSQIIEQLLEGRNYLFGLRPNNGNVQVPTPRSRGRVQQCRYGLAEGREPGLNGAESWSLCVQIGG